MYQLEVKFFKLYVKMYMKGKKLTCGEKGKAEQM